MLFTKMRGRSMQHSFLVGLVCLTIASGISCSSVGSSKNITMCLESERDALLRFKQGLVDDSNTLASWITQKDCCKWRGISCNNHTGHVTSLNISRTIYYFPSHEGPLRGEISPSLLELPYLNYLDLSFNDFQGNKIPEFIGSLSQLKELKLVYANFSGLVPPELGNLSNLHTLDLSYNFDVSSENFEWLSHLSSLTYLDMSGLDLSKVVNWPEFLSKLTSLRELHSSQCNLPNVNIKSLSPLINSSTSLQLLDLSSNYLNSTSIFYWIVNVRTNFVHIDLSWNFLEGLIPNVFTRMLSLVTLDLSWNFLEGPIPNVLTRMLSLVTLNLSRNNLEGGIPKGFQNLCHLESLRLSVNKLSGNIEDSLQAMSCANNTLETLELGNNQFWGSFPELTGFSKLRYFDLFQNNLTRSLPQSVGQLSSLEELNLNENSISGVITESHFRNLSCLRCLDLSGNHFSFNPSFDWNPPFQLTVLLDMSSCKVGPVFPRWILTQTNLIELHLSNIGISRSLPDEFGNIFPSLDLLDLSMNQIHGILPNLSATKLVFVKLFSNLFSGAVPLFPSTLSYLDLSHNKLSEPLSSLCATSSVDLTELDISDNLLSGELSNCWMQFQDLRSLNLRRNKLSEKLPNSFSTLKQIRILRLHENNFSGELPSLENCTNLYTVDLGNNNLLGNIPYWIGQSVQDLVILCLRSNQFDGIISLSLCNLAIIHVLDLSHNKISGALPHCLNNISALADIFFSFLAKFG